MGTFTLNLVSHQVQIEESDGLADEIAEGACANISDLVVSEVNLFNMDSVALQSRADHDQVVISDSISKHVLVISVDNDIDGVVFIIGLLEVLNESIVRVKTGLL